MANFCKVKIKVMLCYFADELKKGVRRHFHPEIFDLVPTPPIHPLSALSPQRKAELQNFKSYPCHTPIGQDGKVSVRFSLVIIFYPCKSGCF